MDLAMQGISEQEVAILLSHDPSHWEAEVIPKYSSVQLTLSGHTHGMQFGLENPYFKWSPVNGYISNGQVFMKIKTNNYMLTEALDF